MEKIICLNQIVLKAKFDAWGDYTSISEIPSSFLDLVKLFSTVLYPNNFSINYIDSEMIIQNINNDNKYIEAIKDSLNNSKPELKLMINIYKQASPDKTLTKRSSFKLNEVIAEESQSDRSENDLSESEKENKKRKGIVLCY
jgi:hypothetical protein